MRLLMITLKSKYSAVLEILNSVNRAVPSDRLRVLTMTFTNSR